MEVKGNNTITLQELFYYLFFGMLFFAKGIGLYDGQFWFKVFLLLGMVFLAAKLCLSRYHKMDLALIFLIIGLTGIAYLVSGDKGMLLYGMLVIGMKNIPIERIFKVGLIVWSISYGGLMLYSFFHLYDSPYKVHDKLGLGRIFRWGLGYSHPNVLHISYFILVLLIVYVVGKKITAKILFRLFLGNCIVFLFSISYTGFAVVAFFLAGIFYIGRREETGLPERLLAETVLFACVGISLLLPVLLAKEHPIFQLFDKALNSRLSLAQYFLAGDNISLFGRELAAITNAQLTMDNAYVFAFIAYGAVLSALLLFLYGRLIYQYGREQKNIEIMIIIAILIAGLTEPFLFNASFKNISFLFLGEYLFRNSADSRPLRPWAGGQGAAACGRKIMAVIKGQYLSRRKQILVTGLLAGILAAGMVWVGEYYPEGYIAPRINCDTISEERHYIGEAAEPQYRDYRIIGNESRDPELPMEFLGGNIALVEKVRGALGTGLIAAAGMILLATAGLSIAAAVRKRNRC